jgi:hypothetical protein
MQHASMLDQPCPTQSEPPQAATSDVPALRSRPDAVSAFETRSVRRRRSNWRSGPPWARSHGCNCGASSKPLFPGSLLYVQPQRTAFRRATPLVGVITPLNGAPTLEAATMIRDNLIGPAMNMGGYIPRHPSSGTMPARTKWH